MTDPLLLVVYPLGGAFLMLVVKLLPPEWSKRLRPLALIPFPFMALTLAAAYGSVTAGEQFTHLLGGFREPVGIGLYLNGVSWLSVALVTVISFLVAGASLSDDAFDGAYHFFLLVMVAGMVIVSVTGDLFTMFVGFEIVAISAYALIAWERTDEALLASLKYLFLSSAGILFFLIGVFIVYRNFGALSLSSVSSATHGGSGGVGELKSTRVAVSLLIVGIGVRTAFIPFHTWLPEAHAYAPHPVSALLSGVLIKISFFAMVRILSVFDAYYLYDLLLWIGAATALVAVVQAMAQRDVKRLLAYHSISQMGFILAAASSVAASTGIAATAAWMHAINHALFKSLLFLAVGTAVSVAGTRDLFSMYGIGRRVPLVAAAIVIGALGITGIPPFNGFGSKYLVGYAVKGSGAYPLLWAASAGTVASFLKLSGVIGMRYAPDNGSIPEREPVAALISVPLSILGTLVLTAGIFANRWAAFISSALGYTGQESLPRIYSVQSLTAVLPVVAAGAGLYLLLMTRRGKAAARTIRGFAPDLRVVLIFFIFGLAAIAGVSVWCIYEPVAG